MPVRRNFSTARKLRATIIVFVLLLVPVNALTLEELLSDTQMTPKRFAAQFELYDFKFNREVQPAQIFLAHRRRDCDDYAVLADFVLRRFPFETRIIRVSLVGRVAHDVCYVTQVKAYLDFNNRKYFSSLQRSGRTIREISAKVADSFEANWTSASEYTYDYLEAKKHFRRAFVKTDPPSKDPDVAPRTK
ncbi:MAG: hypothetical protein EXS38_11015 [Opitutus sp.]|nr:hypothetical protein [Opitutus sp.]